MEKEEKKKKDKDTAYISESFIERLQTFEDTTVAQFDKLGDECVAETLWYKLPTWAHISIVGKDHLCFGGGAHLLLYDTFTQKEYVHKVNSGVVGDGVFFYTGHHTQNLLAFVEQTFCPRIFVLRCPDFEELAILSDGAPEGYKSLTFASNEYIIALSYKPYYNLYLWNWRTKEKIHVEPSGMMVENQYIKCNPLNHPIVVAQLTIRVTPQLLMWEVQPFFKKCLFTKHIVKIPSIVETIVHSCWSTDGVLYLLERSGNVHQVGGYPLTLTRVISTYQVIGDYGPKFCWYKDGIVLINRALEIKHYNRSQGWQVSWELKPRKFKQLLVLRDRLFGWCSGRFYDIDIENNLYKEVHKLTSDTVDFDFIYPLGETFVSFSKDNEVQCWEVATGKCLCTLQYEDEICSIGTNPRYPYIAVGLKIGLLQLVSAIDPTDLKIFTEFHLTTIPITKIIFNRQGNVIVAAHMLYGVIFVLEGLPGEKIDVLSYINYRRTIIDLSIVEMTTQYYIYLLVQRGNHYYCSKKIVCKMVSKLDGRAKKRVFETKLSKHKSKIEEITIDDEEEQEHVIDYEALKYNSETYYSQTTDYYSGICAYNDVLYTIPYQSRNIRVCTLEHRRIKTISEHPSGHFLRKINMSLGDYHVITWGYDGLITLRTLDLQKLLAAFAPHHRCKAGVLKAVCSPTLKYTISIGRGGAVVCTNLVQLEEDPALLSQLQFDFMYNSQRFQAKTFGFIPDLIVEEDGFKGKNFVEFLNHRTYIEEERAANEIKRQLMEQFLILKQEVIELFEANISGPELEKIDILEFYLYKRMRKHKEAMTNFECEWTRRWSKQMIEAQDKVSDWIKTTFWDPMELKKTLLHGIFANFAVENYILLPPKKGERNNYDKLMFRRRAEDLLCTDDAVHPWIPHSQKYLDEHLNKAPSIHKKDERLELFQALESKDEEDEEELDKVENFRKMRIASYGGSSTHKYIEQCKYIYLQTEITTFYQANLQMQLLQEDENNLRIAFNKSFDELMSAKLREMSTIIERNDRLRYIVSELNLTNVPIEDPKWHPSEKPEALTVVEPWEVSITPYISPSQQAILDAQAAEAERIRLALLADDFRERALIEMMWGVLEIRWEDVIKQDIPKPKCMLEKDPEDYTEEDIKAVLKYEKDVTFLMSERARYKNLLEAEYEKLSDTLKESIKKFNSRLRDLLLLKLKVESCRLQEELKVQRLQAWCQERVEYKAKENDAIDIIRHNDSSIGQIQQHMVKVHAALNECKGITDLLLAKDKLLEKQFKKDISDNSNMIQAHSMKLYKKNPRVGTKNVNSSSLLSELARCCITHERTNILTHECLDYLRSVDTLDQYIGVPNSIDENLYKKICTHRRLRLENDLRIKANIVDQQEIENLMTSMQKKLLMKKELATTLAKNLEKAREDTLKHQLNKQIVIVIQQGLVEIPLSGKESDFKNAAMVRRKDVEEINDIILKAGERKLKVMYDKMIHRRNILLKEWEHRHMSMEIEDLQTRMDVVNGVKVSKEIQDFLRKRAKGYAPDKGMLTLDQEIELIKKSYERIILARKVKVEDLEDQIKEYARKNKILDKKIADINIDVCEQHLNRDLEFERQQSLSNRKRMAAIMRRSLLVKQIQDQHTEILTLQTELELLRLKTYPMLKFKTLD